jgi:hypothetical protein
MDQGSTGGGAKRPAAGYKAAVDHRLTSHLHHPLSSAFGKHFLTPDMALEFIPERPKDDKHRTLIVLLDGTGDRYVMISFRALDQTSTRLFAATTTMYLSSTRPADYIANMKVSL